ncbi:hypothetical protein P691DRAFT_568176 [Macrolepiota fuliginosa MF-IS2]|uniref:Peptidase C14 caspase domain-containing protein n=1 Tax=Macrolepiota fuliginosa MF-IS2 TaxID=1400762 RepID=A0A9P5XEA9_9AGAR|nr:hypothetical protein P691DRAFT_568176 [Macrolepiota fuliginosa MF-IS2]
MLPRSYAVTPQAETAEDEIPPSRVSSVATFPARPPRKKALLIGIKYTTLDGKSLVGPHSDVSEMKKLLVGRYAYEEENVTLLIDVEGSQFQPTRKTILVKMRELTLGAQPGDTLFFHYAGHSTQVENKDNSEEDGKDEYIVPLDGCDTPTGCIKDNDLRKYLVDPLPQGCTLVAIFDCCHSGSLLDLEHAKCNAVYTPWVSKGKRRTNTMWKNGKTTPCQCLSSLI